MHSLPQMSYTRNWRLYRPADKTQPILSLSLSLHAQIMVYSSIKSLFLQSRPSPSSPGTGIRLYWSSRGAVWVGLTRKQLLCCALLMLAALSSTRTLAEQCVTGEESSCIATCNNGTVLDLSKVFTCTVRSWVDLLVFLAL